jgi:hypothetical protein
MYEDFNETSPTSKSTLKFIKILSLIKSDWNF